MTTDREGQEPTTWTVVVYYKDTGVIEKVVRTDNPEWIDIQVDDPDVQDRVVLVEEVPIVEKHTHYINLQERALLPRPDSTVSINKSLMAPGEEATISNLPWGTKAEVYREIGTQIVDMVIYDQHNEGVITDGFLTLSSQEECVIRVKVVPPWPERGVEYAIEVTGPFVP